MGNPDAPIHAFHTELAELAYEDTSRKLLSAIQGIGPVKAAVCAVTTRSRRPFERARVIRAGLQPVTILFHKITVKRDHDPNQTSNEPLYLGTRPAGMIRMSRAATSMNTESIECSAGVALEAKKAHPAICQYCHVDWNLGIARLCISGGLRGSPWMVLGTLAEDTAGDGPN